MNNRNFCSLEMQYVNKNHKNLIKKKYKFFTDYIILIGAHFASLGVGKLIHSSVIHYWKDSSGATSLTQRYWDVKKYLNKYSEWFFTKNECNLACQSLLNKNNKCYTSYMEKHFDHDLLVNYLDEFLASGDEIIDATQSEFLIPPLPELVNLVGKCAWLLDNAGRVIHFDKAWQAYLKQPLEEDPIAFLHTPYTTLITTFKNGILGLKLYENNPEERFLVNLLNQHDDPRLHSYYGSYVKILFTYFLPAEAFVCWLTGATMTAVLKNKMIHSRLFKKMVHMSMEHEQNKFSKKEQIAIENNQTEGLPGLRKRVSALSSLIRLQNVIKTTFDFIWLGYTAYNIVQFTVPPDYEDPSKNEASFSFLVKLILLISMFSHIISRFYQFRQTALAEANIQNNYQNIKNLIDRTTTDVRYGDIEHCEGTDLMDAVFAFYVKGEPEKQKIKLTGKQIASIVQLAFKSQGQCIEISPTEKYDIYKLVIKITQLPDEDIIHNKINTVIDRLKNIILFSKQVKKLNASIKTSKVFTKTTSPIDSDESPLVKTILAFLNTERASDCLNILKEQPLFQKIEIKQKEHRLIFYAHPLNSPFAMNHSFKQMCSQFNRKWNEQTEMSRLSSESINKESSLSMITQPAPVLPLLVPDNIVTVQNIKNIDNKYKEKMPSTQARNTKGILSSLHQINNAPFWSKNKPRYLKCSLNLADFGGDKELQDHCIKKIKEANMGKKGEKKMNKKPGLFLLSSTKTLEKFTHCKTGEEYTPSVKFTIKSHKNGWGNCRMWGIKASWDVPGAGKVMGYDLVTVERDTVTHT